MPLPGHRTLHTARIKSAAYDEASRSLEIAFHDGKLSTWRGVPAEIARRFFASPNPTTFWEDRIAEEYPVSHGRAAGSTDARSRLDDLFGAPPAGAPPTERD